MQLAMIQDRIISMEELDPVYLDRGIFFGDGVYEVVRSYKGRIFALQEHLERFANSLAAIRITNVDISEVRARVEKAFATAAIANAKIYFHITRGSGPRDHAFSAGLQPNFFLTITELPDDTEDKTKGVAVSIHPDLRWKRCDIKSLNLLPNVLARQDAADKGCSEAILVDESGFITEGSHSAFFAVFGHPPDKESGIWGPLKQTLQTTPLDANVLPSITRNYVITAAKEVGLAIVERPLTPEQVRHADELFIAVTTKDIVPVVKFDGTVIGNGTPGAQTKSLARKFREFTK
jgi:D-alanine transaminase